MCGDLGVLPWGMTVRKVLTSHNWDQPVAATKDLPGMHVLSHAPDGHVERMSYRHWRELAVRWDGMAMAGRN